MNTDFSSDIVIFDTKLKAERDYWVQRLGGVSTTSVLTPDYQRHGSGARERIEIVVPGELSQQVSGLAGGSDFLVYTALMAALKLCLYKYTNQQLIAVGSPPLQELGKANALTIVDQLDSELSFQELLLQVRESLLAAYAHQHYPFSRLLRDLRLESNGSCPLFSVALVLTDLHGTLAETKHDVTLTFTRSGDELSGYLEFKSERFKPASVERLRDHLINILRAGVADNQQRLREFELTTVSEREQLLRTWNQTQKDYPSETYLHRLFEEQVKKHPTNIAVKFAGETLTYDELNRKANQLARRLRHLGVGPDMLVGLHLERSFNLVIGMLAVLKAGGAYMPLDLIYPKERLAFMLSDAGLKVLLTQQHLVNNLPQHEAATVLPDSWESFASESEEDLDDAELNSDNLAYVLYTSGSTGRPKGAMISHRSLLNYLFWATRAYHVAAGTGAPVHSPIGFDLTLTGLFTPLLAGKSIVLLREEEGVEDLLTALRDHDFSLVKLTPAHLEVLKAMPSAEIAAQRARLFVVGGEALYGESLSFWREHNPDVRIVNEYGPTETVVGCCVYEVPFGDSIDETVPIGRPIDNTQLYILDPHMKPLPLGIAGELYIGGVGLARGYLKRPELTAERFVPDPFGDGAGKRLYRTGDLVRARMDGTLEFIGRRDRQVKIRGYRIELAEVETTLIRLPEVREAVVALDDTTLIAYVVSDGSSDEIRRALQAQLPAYMVPSQVVALERFPLTTHGKVDQRELRALAAAAERNTGEGGTPLTEVEQGVAEMWGEALGVKSVGREANFFDLGGHSLLAMQVIGRVRERFQIEIPLHRLFEWPTVAEFAGQIEAIRQTAEPSADVIQPIARQGALPLSFAQERFWYLDRLRPGNPDYNCCSLLHVTGPLNVPALEQAINQIIRRHEVLRTIFAEVEEQPVQVILPDQPITLPVLDLNDSEARAVQERLASAEAQRPFDLSTGPLIRAHVRRINEREHLVAVTMHHIVNDGWSSDLFCKELASIYSSYVAGEPSRLTAPPIQYADFAHWERKQLSDDRLRAQRSYWQQQLANLPEPITLSEQPLPPRSPRVARTQCFSIADSTLNHLQQFTRDYGVTLYATLMAGFAALLHLYSGEDDIVIGTPLSNRNRKETEELIGCLINTLALRVNLKGDPTFAELAKQVQKVMLAAQANQALPFEVVAGSLASKTGKRTPLFRHWFVLVQNVAALKVDEALGLKWEIDEVAAPSAQFELTMMVHQIGSALSCALVYAAGELDAQTMQSLAADYEALLAAALEQPNASILQLSWMEHVVEQTVERAVAHE
jgi:amino acid adenylation domain-containing protein